MNLLFPLIIFHPFFIRVSYTLNLDELEISFDLIKTLGIHQCILIGNHDNVVQNIKKFSMANIPTTSYKFNALANYIFNGKVDSKIAIIWKDEDLTNQHKITYDLEEVSLFIGGENPQQGRKLERNFREQLTTRTHMGTKLLLFLKNSFPPFHPIPVFPAKKSPLA